MTTHKSGSRSFFRDASRLLACAGAAFLALLALWTGSAIPSHTAGMAHLERALAHMEHPPNTTHIARYRHFGDGSVSGSGYEACHYYAAEIRSSDDIFENISRHYERTAPHFSDAAVYTLPIAEDSLFFGLDFPITYWIEEHIARGDTDAYIVYLKRVDENTIGDIRCWVL